MMNAQHSSPTDDPSSIADRFPTETASARHVIVLPGGGYASYAENEARPIAEWLRLRGLSANVFRYPVQARHPAPLEALRAEIRRVRASGVERMALMGFSAGGHLAGHAALTPSASDPDRVDAVILCYPVVSMELDTDPGSQRELLGTAPRPKERAATSLDRLVTTSAPPFFIWHTANDPTVSVQHSYLLAQALARNGISHALHVFPEGAHGLGLAQGTGEPEAWPALCTSWLAAQGWLDEPSAHPTAGA